MASIRTVRKSLGLGVRTGSLPRQHEPDGPVNAPKGKATRRKWREYGLRPPRDLQRLCRRVGGLNFFGGPMYRLSWAPSQLSWMAGKWLCSDENGNFKWFVTDAGWAPKYPQYRERFVLELWKPPWAYGTQEAWEEINRQPEENGQVLGRLGPYPHLGDYEPIFLFETGDGTRRFINPTAELCEARIQEHRVFSEQPARTARLLKEAREAEEAAKRRAQSDILSEPFSGLNGLLTPFISLSGVDVPKATPQEVS